MFFLGLLQGTDYVVPIVAIPILINRIGLDGYGIIVLSQGVINVITVFTDFGFTLTGTRLITQYRADPEFTSQTIQKIFLARAVLLIIGLFILVTTVLMVPQWRIHFPVFLAGYLMVLGTVFLPVWYFQGIQKMGFLTVLNFVSRVLYISSIIFLINANSPIYMVNVYNGLSMSLSATLGIALLIRSAPIKLKSIKSNEIYQFIKLNSSITVSQAIDTLYRNGAIMIASFLFNSSLLAIYGILDKIMQLIQRSFAIVYRAIFPIVCELIRKGLRSVREFYTRFLLLAIGPVIVISVLLWSYGAELLKLISSDLEGYSLEKYMFLVAFFPILLLFNLPLSTFLVARDLKREYLLYNVSALIVFILLAVSLGATSEIGGLISATLITEMGIAVLGIVLIFKSSNQ